MRRVREKKRWRKEEKMERKEKEEEISPPFNRILHPPLTVEQACRDALRK
jgi:hypothetical protein